MSWVPLKNIVDGHLATRGLDTRITEALVLEQANQIIAKFFGKDSSSKARAIYFRNGALTIAVLSNGLYSEIASQSQEFLNILNNQLNDDLVEELQFLS